MSKPWESEPDEVSFQHSGLDCKIVRNPRSKHLCGYVRLPVGHPLYKVPYNAPVPASLERLRDEVYNKPVGNRSPIHILLVALGGGGSSLTSGDLIDVHGSVTFSGESYWTEIPGCWWYGFDCAHYGDYQPGIHSDGEYRDIDYVRQQTTSMAEQLAAMAKEVQR